MIILPLDAGFGSTPNFFSSISEVPHPTASKLGDDIAQ